MGARRITKAGQSKLTDAGSDRYRVLGFFQASQAVEDRGFADLINTLAGFTSEDQLGSTSGIEGGKCTQGDCVDVTDGLALAIALVNLATLLSTVADEAVGAFRATKGPNLGNVADGLSLNSSNELAGVERASDDLLSAVAERRTVEFAAPGSEELRYLDAVGAEANVGGPNMDHILLRSDPSKAAVLEEFLHGTQHRLGIIDRLGPAGAETHVKDFMIRHSRLLGLGEEDVLRLSILKEMGL